MIIENQLNLLKEIFGSPDRTGDEYLFYCPSCKHFKKKLSVNLKKKVFKCWVCSYASTTLRTIIEKYGTERQLSQWDLEAEKIDFSSLDEQNLETIEVSLPDGFEPLYGKQSDPEKIKAKRYLYNRGITKNDLIKWKIGFCSKGKFKNKIIVPSFNIYGNLDYFVARDYFQKGRYTNPSVSKDVVFNSLYINQMEELIVVEGVFDAIKCKNAFPLLGSSLKEDSIKFQYLVNYKKPVYFALDKDAKKKQQRMINLLLRYDKEVYAIDVSPFKDVGEMKKEEFLEKKDKAVKINNENSLEYMLKMAI